MTDETDLDELDPAGRADFARRYPITAGWDDVIERTMNAVRTAASVGEGIDVGVLLNDVTATLTSGLRSALFQIEARLNDFKGDTPPIPGD